MAVGAGQPEAARAGDDHGVAGLLEALVAGPADHRRHAREQDEPLQCEVAQRQHRGRAGEHQGHGDDEQVG